MKSWILIFLSASCFAATHTVKSGSSIQSALEKAKSGDTVEVYPGVYTELILMDKENVRLIGKLQNVDSAGKIVPTAGHSRSPRVCFAYHIALAGLATTQFP